MMSNAVKKPTGSGSWARSVGATTRSKNDHLLEFVVGRLKGQQVQKPKKTDDSKNHK
jgi:hypothetical protein